MTSSRRPQPSTGGEGVAPTQRRRRDPNRKQTILTAAAALVSQRGYAGVSMAEIGAEVGIAASAIYWHFPSKQDLLVAVFDECLDRLRAEQADALAERGYSWEALSEITRRQITFVVNERAFARVYYREAAHLAEADLVRLRAKQRSYVDNWANLLRRVRPELSRAQSVSIVHAVIGTIQSCLVYRSRLASAELRGLLESAALQVLRAPVSPEAI